MRKAFIAVAFIAVALSAFGFQKYGTTYECSGLLTKDKQSEAVKVFISIVQNRWWVFWDRTEGWVLLEIPSTTVPIRTAAFPIQGHGRRYLDLHRWPKEGEVSDLGQPVGQFSTISYALVLAITDEVSFRGTCTPKNN